MLKRGQKQAKGVLVVLKKGVKTGKTHLGRVKKMQKTGKRRFGHCGNFDLSSCISNKYTEIILKSPLFRQKIEREGFFEMYLDRLSVKMRLWVNIRNFGGIGKGRELMDGFVKRCWQVD